MLARGLEGGLQPLLVLRLVEYLEVIALPVQPHKFALQLELTAQAHRNENPPLAVDLGIRAVMLREEGDVSGIRMPPEGRCEPL
jgi:hypothetical protein